MDGIYIFPRMRYLSLKLFYLKLVNARPLVFDDYGFYDHSETKRVVDDFFQSKNANLLQLPTGQALVFKIHPSA
jgi:hypothetical protein